MDLPFFEDPVRNALLRRAVHPHLPDEYIRIEGYIWSRGGTWYNIRCALVMAYREWQWMRRKAGIHDLPEPGEREQEYKNARRVLGVPERQISPMAEATEEQWEQQ